ncbi:hypothetical protein GOBAR_DD22057 [Gossypium barbadense]|nr:hypothetical protein GOBAR_DD22057 [Gossypium barbadense]
MITLTDFYHVMTAMVPLYVAMILAYGSVKWWKIFSPGQCSGINRFVALFAVPLLSFHFIASNDPYAMNFRFIAADTLQKVMVLGILAVWSKVSKRGCLEWTITLFSLSTLPNTLVMGIPLLKGMYGEFSGSLMVQIVVLQCIIWYTLMLFMFEYRGAKMLISEQFPDTAGSIVSIHVDSDIMSLDGRQPLETEAEIKEDGKLHVTVRKSNASRSDIFSRRSQGLSSTTPRPSNLTNAEIYSLQSSRNPTPRGSSFNHTDFYSMMAGGRNSNFGAADVYGLFMALQPRIIACGNSVAAFAMGVRFLAGPAVMAAASIAVGLRGVLLHVAIVQAALPQGIVPFVFAKEYNLHPDILSTAVIFGMLIALPITLVYYILLGL